MDSPTTTVEPGQSADQVYDPQVVGISSEGTTQAGDENDESLNKLRGMKKEAEITVDVNSGNEVEGTTMTIQPTSFTSPSRTGTQQDPTGESTYALMALSSLASLGSLPPIPNLGGSNVTNEGNGLDNEASGSGSRSGSMDAVTPSVSAAAAQILGLEGQHGEQSMDGYPTRPVSDPYNEDYNNDTSIQTDISGDTTRRSRSGRGRGRKRKQDERTFVGEPGTNGGSGVDELEGTDGQGQSGGSGNGNGNGEGGKRLKRAEQNRLAQQTFRKRREERMKQLEEKTKEMERLNEAVDEGRRRVGEVELENEAMRMENQGLRDIVRSLSRATGAIRDVLDDRGDFILPESDPDRNADVQMENVEEAIGVTTPDLEVQVQESAPIPAREPGMEAEDEVVRNLLNVSNEINAANADSQDTTMDDRIALALDRLRERSRGIVQAADMKRRQALIQQAALRETQEAALRWEAEATRHAAAQRHLDEEERTVQSEHDANPRNQADLVPTARPAPESSPEDRHVSISQDRVDALVESSQPIRIPAQYPDQRSPPS